MPPVTRRQAKRVEPYSKENCSTERRMALLDINTSKTVAKSNANKSNERIFKQSNIAKIETATQKNEIAKLDTSAKLEVKTEDLSVTKEPPRISLNSTKDSSLYLSACEEISVIKRPEDDSVNKQSELLLHSATQEMSIDSDSDSDIVDEIFEVDKNNWSDYMSVGCYAQEIFKYLRLREDTFKVTDYINDQSELTPRHRAIVVNWLVTIQDHLELNHEVLYMAVRFIDLYLMKNDLPKSKFQLLAAAAVLLAIKVDERGLGFPNILVKHSRYIFTEEELLVTERELVKSLNGDINVPMSYVFLRRFARCFHCQMVLLTLARYILEESLLDYKFVFLKESLKAAAALFLAFKMSSQCVDAKEFLKYTGYSVSDIKSTVYKLNNLLHKPREDLDSVKQKYLHKIFYKVANKSPLNNSQISFD